MHVLDHPLKRNAVSNRNNVCGVNNIAFSTLQMTCVNVNENMHVPSADISLLCNVPESRSLYCNDGNSTTVMHVGSAVSSQDLSVSSNVNECSINEIDNQNLSNESDSIICLASDVIVSSQPCVFPQNAGQNNCLADLRQKFSHNMIFAHLNVKSLQFKLQEVRDMLSVGQLDVLILSETKLDASHNNAVYEIDNYTLYRQDKQPRSGGLVAYVSKDIPSSLGPINCNQTDLEVMTVELNYNDHKIILACMYKNPKMPSCLFEEKFKNFCECMYDHCDHIVIMGDLNFNMLTSNMLSNLCPTFNLQNLISEPTCFKSANPTLIDVMLVSKRKKFLHGFSMDTGISDYHNLIGGVLRLHKPMPQKKKVSFRKLSSINYDTVIEKISNANLEERITCAKDANEAFKLFHGSLTDVFDYCAPKREKIIKRNDFPCMTPRLRKAILIRNKYRNRFFKYRSDSNFAMYCKHRNMVTKIKKDEIQTYF